MASEATSFSLGIQRWCERAGERADVVVRKVALEMFTRVIMRSPVDTGRFRGNWQVTVSSPATGTLEMLDKSGEGAVARAATVVAGARAGGVIWLTNNLPYARRLEYGWSAQAPAGMVRVTYEEFRAVVEGAVSEGATT